ncbi:DUF3570 domain-containing protein [Methylomonas sp. CM2]|uniref:DUF3570 domain-containing protein n=1 Tax=Methylomonas sp. CM2 TaxID=3417647 RepID=UPI003CFAA652
MAAIKSEKSKALAALTTAALSLPGLDCAAGVPSTQAEGNTEYGYYQESSGRMNVQIFHADGLIPLNDRLEFNFSLDRDTYTGASPAYSLPSAMTNQPVAIKTTENGKDYADVVSAASAVSAATLSGAESLLQTSSFYQEAYNSILTSLNDADAAIYGNNIPQDVLANNQQIASLAGFDAALNNFIPANDKAVQRFQTQPLETRTQPVLGLKYYFDDTTLGITGGQSEEPDFQSNFGSLNFSHEFNDKLTTVSGGYSVTRNAIFRNGGHSHTPSGLGLGHIHPADCEISTCTDYSSLNANSLFHGVNLAISHVLDKNTLLNLAGSFTHQSGFLSNAYKTVYVRGEITPEEYLALSNTGANSAIDWKAISKLEIVGPELFRENRPGQRNLFSFSGGVNHYFPALDAALHFDYRYYHDDWKIDAHTFEMKWLQSLPFGITVTPSVRYYSQSKADFFAPYYLAPRADGFYSSDFRLSGFGALSGGVILSKQIGKAVKLEAGFEYYQRASAFKLGGGGGSDYADYSYYLAHAGVNINLSAPGSLLSGDGSLIDSLFGDGDPHAHHHHHHHGAPVPAGVMFGHMMPKADDVMVGYMYMYNGQAGTMLHGSQAVSDAQIVAGGCPGYGSGVPAFNGCLVKPASMHMGMHMLDIMYAPTDWLNLMVMPQLMDMDMTMSDDLRAANYTPNSTYTEKHYVTDTSSFYAGMHHTVFDLGDTSLIALVKLFDDTAHHLHAGIGVSAPTGNVAIPHTTLSTVNVPDSLGADHFYQANIKVLQDYGMQSGSGTWDFKPTLTYTGEHDDVFWGAQFSAVKRLQDKNKSGYALGDTYQGSTWAGYKVTPWLSGTVRGVYTQQNKLKGDLYQLNPTALLQGQTTQLAHNLTSTVDYPQNSGGHYWDIGLGLQVAVPGGKFAGHTFSLEWLQPIQDYVNGYQLERTGAFSARWNYMF